MNSEFKSEDKVLLVTISLIFLNLIIFPILVFGHFSTDEYYIWMLTSFTILVFSFGYTASFFTKPWKRETIKKMDYWYYGIAAIGVIFYASYEADNRNEIELRLFSGEIAPFIKENYPVINSFCKKDRFIVSDICTEYMSYGETYSNANTIEFKKFYEQWYYFANSFFFIESLQIVFSEYGNDEITVDGFINDVESLSKLAGKKNFVMSRQNANTTYAEIPRVAILILWPFIFIIAISLKLSKTLIEQKEWIVE